MSSSRISSADAPPPHPFKENDEVWIDRWRRPTGRPGHNTGRRAVVVAVFWDGDDPYVSVRFRDFPMERQKGTPLHFKCSRVSRVDAVTRLGELDA